jgi:hypothetical protein
MVGGGGKLMGEKYACRVAEQDAKTTGEVPRKMI